MSLFSGLDQFGLGKLEKVNIFEEETKKTDKSGKRRIYFLISPIPVLSATRNFMQKCFVPVK